MSTLIKHSRGLLGLGVFVVVLWAFVVVSYARQVKQDGANAGLLRPLTGESCSSGTSSGSSGGEP